MIESGSFDRHVCSIPKDRILEFGVEAAFGRYKQFFPDDAIAHPAKANLGMIEWIIKQYTKEGDTVLDCMAGTFSTCIVAALNNRNAIGVELEEKFYNWGLEAKRRIETTQTLAPKGKMVVFKGDARELSKVLAENADLVCFSPPYGNRLADTKVDDDDPQRMGYRQAGAKDPTNVGNLDYRADAVFFSPPFAERHPYPDLEREQKIHKKYFPNKGQISTKYSDDPRNIGNLDYGASAIIFSPPFAKSQVARDKEFLRRMAEGGWYGDDRKNVNWDKSFGGEYAPSDGSIGGFPYGEIDAIVTSPPYSGQVSTEGDPERRAERMQAVGLDPKTIVGGKVRCGEIDWRYSKDKSNIGNLPHGDVDAIITSPPYEAQVSKKTQEMKRLFALYREGKLSGEMERKVEDWIKRPDKNLGIVGMMEISYTKNVDAIVTSPPYEKQVHDTLEKRESVPSGKIHEKRGLPVGYSESKNNIGNLKAGTYLGAMLQVYRECFKILKPGGVMVLITKKFIRQKKIVRLDLDTIKLCEAAGFTFVERWYRKLKQPSFWRIIYAKNFNYCPQCIKVYRVRKATSDKPMMIECPACHKKLLPMLILFEDILVFRKLEDAGEGG
jgi:DNA modification methylase